MLTQEQKLLAIAAYGGDWTDICPDWVFDAVEAVLAAQLDPTTERETRTAEVDAEVAAAHEALTMLGAPIYGPKGLTLPIPERLAAYVSEVEASYDPLRRALAFMRKLSADKSRRIAELELELARHKLGRD